jgi:ATPase subunit of ABC transporter with duplicated ATPase domains
MLTLQNISYQHPNKDLLFENINLSLDSQAKIALIGNNGIGKSTLLKIIAGILPPAAGTVKAGSKPYYVPQHFGQYDDLTIAEALHVSEKLKALKEIFDGVLTESNLSTLNDDWSIEERCHEALADWKLQGLQLSQHMKALSGGQKTKVFLAGISIHQPELILLDEPGNHLDTSGRALLHEFIQSTFRSIILVSHDRKLLNLVYSTYELGKSGITVYGGNYDFYAAQKMIERNAFNQELKTKEKALRKAKETARETIERQQKLDARGKKKQEKAGVPTIMMNTLRNNAEKSTSRIKDVHTEKVGAISDELNDLRRAIPDADKMKFGFDDAALHKGKILFTAKSINYGYCEQLLWKQNLDIEFTSGERVLLKGFNGSGKTTVMKIVLGEIQPKCGKVFRAESKLVYIDQDYSLIDNQITVYAQAQRFNHTALQEHEVKSRLTRFLFTKAFWDKSCNDLSGGEKMRLMLCCVSILNKAPDMIILDEPTNNLDIQNTEILTRAINDYQGTLLVVSHDQSFLEQINIEREIDLNQVATR